MTAKHFRQIAGVIAGERAMARQRLTGPADRIAEGRAVLAATRNLALSLADVCAAANSRFDRERFYLAAGVTDVYSELGE